MYYDCVIIDAACIKYIEYCQKNKKKHKKGLNVPKNVHKKEKHHKKYIKEFVARNPQACLQSVDPGLQPVTVCIDKICKSTNKTTNVKWYEWLRKNPK